MRLFFNSCTLTWIAIISLFFYFLYNSTHNIHFHLKFLSFYMLIKLSPIKSTHFRTLDTTCSIILLRLLYSKEKTPYIIAPKFEILYLYTKLSF